MEGAVPASMKEKITKEERLRWLEEARRTQKARRAGELGLSAKQEAFIEQYLLLLDATEAAWRASGGITTRKSAHVTGQRWLKIPEVAAEIKRRRLARSKRVQASTDDVLRELIRLMGSDVRRVLRDDGRLMDVKKLPTEVARTIASIEVVERQGRGGTGESTVTKLRFWDKTKVLEMLCRHLGLFEETVAPQVPLFSLPAGTIVEVGQPRVTPHALPSVTDTPSALPEEETTDAV